MERRDVDRIPFEMFLNQYVDERLHRGVTSNLSPTGLYVNRVAQGVLARSRRLVQLEFALPGTREVIWALGEVRRDELDLAQGLIHGTAIRLVELARAHRRLLRDFVEDHARLSLCAGSSSPPPSW